MDFTDLSSIPFSLPRSRVQCRSFGMYYRQIWWTLDFEQSFLTNQLSLLQVDLAQIEQTISDLNNEIASQETAITNQKANIISLQNTLISLENASPQDPNAIAQAQTNLDNAQQQLIQMQNDLQQFQNQFAGANATYTRYSNNITTDASLYNARVSMKSQLESQMTNIELIYNFLATNDLQAINNPNDMTKFLSFNANLLSQLQTASSSSLNNMVATLQANNYDMTNPNVIEAIAVCFAIENQQQAVNQVYAEVQNGFLPTTTNINLYIPNIIGDPS